MATDTLVVTGAGIRSGEEAQETVNKMVEIQNRMLSSVDRRCRKVMGMIVPNANWAQVGGNKTDTIAVSHVDFSLLPAPLCDCAGIDGAAFDPPDCALCVAGGCWRRNAGVCKCDCLAGAAAF